MLILNTYDRNGILADIFEPHVLDGAATTNAVDTLVLIGANDDITESSTLSKDEDGISLTCS